MLHLNLNQHQNTVYSIRFSGQNYSEHERLHSYPLYAIAKAIGMNWFLMGSEVHLPGCRA